MKSLAGPLWTLGDVLDYEYPQDLTDFAPTIRSWANSYSGPSRRRRRLLAWVRYRQSTGSTPLPGYLVQRSLRVLALILTVLGFLAGIGLGWGVLAYGGGIAVNLLMALVLLIGVPAVFSSISLILAVIPVSGRRSRHLVDRFQRIIISILKFSKGLRMVDQNTIDAIQSGAARLRERSSRYTGILRWSMAVPLQLRGLGFQSGIFLAVFWRGVVQDVAFAWQTTLGIPAEKVHELATALAAPWSSMVAPPSLEQVAGSRVVLKDGLAALDNADLISWWPFVCCAVVAYGVLPRLILLIHSLIRRIIAAGTLSFLDTRARSIQEFMDHETLEVTGGEPEGKARRISGKDPEDGRLLLRGRNLHVVYPGSRHDLEDLDLWRRVLNNSTVARFYPSPSLDDEDDTDLLKPLKDLHPAKDGVIVIFEGWRPYTEAVTLYINALKTSLPTGLPLTVGLAGREDERFEERDAESLVQWRRRLSVNLGGTNAGYFILGDNQ